MKSSNLWLLNTNTHTQPFNSPLSWTTRVGRYQKKHSPTHTHPDHQTSFINFLHRLRSIASSLFDLRAWQAFSTTSLQVLFGLPLGQEPCTSYSIHFFIQSLSSFHNTCPYHSNLFCCSTEIMNTNIQNTHPFNGPFPGLPRWAGTRKVKPIWILLKQETVSGSGINWAVCKSAPRSRQITMPAPHYSVFYRPDALPAAQPTASNHWR